MNSVCARYVLKRALATCLMHFIQSSSKVRRWEYFHRIASAAQTEMHSTRNQSLIRCCWVAGERMGTTENRITAVPLVSIRFTNEVLRPEPGSDVI